jgi:hypothetical protein
MKTQKNWWRWWAKAIGEKASKCNNESDKIALIRTIIFSTYLITNCFIIAGVARHWNKNKEVQVVYLKQNCNQSGELK